MNSNQNQVAPSPSTKQPANGQIVWGGQRIQYAAQTQHPSNQVNIFRDTVFFTNGSNCSEAIENRTVKFVDYVVVVAIFNLNL